MAGKFIATDYPEIVGFDGGFDKVKANMFKVAMMTYSGANSKEIAQELGVTPKVITTLQNSDEFKQICGELTDTAKMAATTYLSSAADMAVGVLVNGLQSDNERIRIQCANSILDRIGIKGNQVIEHINKQDELGGLSDAELQAIVAKGAADGLVIEGEVYE